MDLKEKINKSPNNAGVYLIKDKDGSIIYIGKAAFIRKRLKSHFTGQAGPKQKALIEHAAGVDHILTPDESSALLLEAALIKRHKPRYNVFLKDDKSYPRLKLTVNEEYPRLFITRRPKDDGALYFGPYTDAKLLRKALMSMRRLFPLRTCVKVPGKSCLNLHIGQCLAPCVDKSRKDEYLRVVKELRLFLDGEREELLRSLAEQMKTVSESKDFERAAMIRDRIKALSVVGHYDAKVPDIKGTGLKARTSLAPSVQIEELRAILKLTKPPSLIEAFDISNISGKEAVGSLVSFKDGRPNTGQYRKFKIKTVNVIDDYSMMREIISRRYRHGPVVLPDLIIIDGGKGHLAAAKKELRSLKLWRIPVISIAKGPDRIFASESKEPLTLGRFEGALLLVQRIRDEAHRCAIDYHRLLRRKETAVSELDNIEGIGPKRKASLIRHFGSLDEIKMADIEDLKKVKMIDGKAAEAIHDFFR
ncbi:MAG: excinuclease ABC subunit UvrC [Candidatus Omnitrophica bacterium]|nr:excinuclease ABC subunit UvrC [Candidatus Omnitrophota bacterium]